MLNDFTGADQVYIACGYTDLRKGIDGLARLVQQQFELDPFTNTLFLFCGRRRDRIKGLYWEKDGFILRSIRAEDEEAYWGIFPMDPEVVRLTGGRADFTREEVLAAYPGLLSDEKDWNWAYPDDYLWYCDNETGFGPHLYFFFANDVVYMIQMVDFFD